MLISKSNENSSNLKTSNFLCNAKVNFQTGCRTVNFLATDVVVQACNPRTLEAEERESSWIQDQHAIFNALQETNLLQNVRENRKIIYGTFKLKKLLLKWKNPDKIHIYSRRNLQI